jgi:uncharacterized membrane-anchored protein
MALQFWLPRYVPYVYWLAVIFMSICGTIFTDGLHDDLGVELWIECIVFFVLMVVSFALWYKVEGTLDVHSINTVRREAFYWYVEVALIYVVLLINFGHYFPTTTNALFCP